MSKENELYKVAMFGMKVNKFLGSDIGLYIIDKCHEASEMSINGLKTIDPTDIRSITRLQNEIYRAESIPQWLSQAVFQGQQAEQMLMQLDEYDSTEIGEHDE